MKGNKVKNGSFEQPSSTGSTPDGWSGQSTPAGQATWSDGGSDGSKSASTTGSGGNAAILGPPTWTSDPIAVTPGEALDLSVAVRVVGASSAPSVGLAYLGAGGELVRTVTALTAPLSTEWVQRPLDDADGAGGRRAGAGRPHGLLAPRPGDAGDGHVRRRAALRALARREEGV